MTAKLNDSKINPKETIHFCISATLNTCMADVFYFLTELLKYNKTDFGQNEFVIIANNANFGKCKFRT